MATPFAGEMSGANEKSQLGRLRKLHSGKRLPVFQDPKKTSTDHKGDEKLEGTDFLVCDKARTELENRGNNEKHDRLGKRVQQNAPGSSVHRML